MKSRKLKVYRATNCPYMNTHNWNGGTHIIKTWVMGYGIPKCWKSSVPAPTNFL